MRLSPELKVGIFAIIVIAVLMFMTFKVGSLEWLGRKGYVVTVYFKDVAGLDKNTKVKIAGVSAGTVERIDLIDSRAKLTLRMHPGIVLYEDALASINSTGLLGDKYLAIRPGSTGAALRDGDSIKRVEEVFSMDDVVKNLTTIAHSISTVTDNLNDVLGREDTKQNLRETIVHLRELTERLVPAIGENDRRMRQTLDNINRLARSLQGVVDDNAGNIKDSLANVREFTDTLKTDGPELVRNIKETTASLKDVSRKIDEGQGTLGKLVADDKLYNSVSDVAANLNKTLSNIDRFRVYLTFQGEYLTRVENAKGYFYVTLQPRPDKYYILGVVGDPLGHVTRTKTQTTTNGVTTESEEVKTETRFEFTALYGQRFWDTVLRAGIMESTMGGGIDQFLFKDKLKLTVDAWDWGKREEGAKRPHVKAGAEFNFYKGLFLSAGYDNIFNSKWSGAYVGGGLRFEDEDLKYLFGYVPAGAVK